MYSLVTYTHMYVHEHTVPCQVVPQLCRLVLVKWYTQYDTYNTVYASGLSSVPNLVEVGLCALVLQWPRRKEVHDMYIHVICCLLHVHVHVDTAA